MLRPSSAAQRFGSKPALFYWEGRSAVGRVRWLGNLDSNQDKQSQSLLCYRYTIPQYFRTISTAYIGKRLPRLRRL